MPPDSAGSPPTSLVALRDRRDQVIARVSDAYAEDLLDVDELDRRLDVAYRARDLAELDALVADLAPSTALVPARGATLAIADPARPPTKTLRSIFSSLERRGPWVVPTELAVRTWWGNALLDFRDASLGPGTTTLAIHVTMGNLEIILPPGLAVDVDVSAFMGNVEERHRVPLDPDPARPLLRITGAVRLGNLEITTRLPGETEREARKRERHERKALAASARRALPPGR